MPGVGKTTLAKPLAQTLDLPLIEKDSIKEFLFDTLGTRDREWSRTLGMASNDFIYALSSILLSRGESLIIENSFEAAFAKPEIKKIADKYDPDIYEIYCSTKSEIRRERFINRNESGNRHVGHSDVENYPTDTDQEPLEKYSPIDIGIRINVDTTRENIDINALANLICSS